jgi:hypothetical protein
MDGKQALQASLLSLNVTVLWKDYGENSLVD